MILKSCLLSALLGVALAFAPPFCRASEEASEVSYGDNTSVGKTVEINGVPVYYEVYGSGEPMLIIHPNGGSISAMAPQIEFFAKKYRVIAADSRDFGRTPLGEGKLTYELIASDLEGLLDHLQIKSETILGWSDGGILGLMLAIDHPERVTRLAIMGANLNPEGANDWAIAWVRRMTEKVDQALAKNPEQEQLKRIRPTLDLMGNQPHIPIGDLAKITAPTLVMAGDRDVIKTSHTVEIFEALPHAQLCIFPGATHQISEADPERFNRTVDDFLSKPFQRPDSKDGMK